MDYCTGWFEGWWQQCCQAHDLAYDKQEPRLSADFDMLVCVANSFPDTLPILNELGAGLSLVVGLAMYAAVHVLGWYFYRKARP